MFVFAIETCGRTVAFTKETDRVMLNGILSGDRDEGRHLRNGLFFMPGSNWNRWDGVSPFTARLATDSEELDYDITTSEYLQSDTFDDNESILVFSLSNDRDENFLAIPPSLKAA